VVYLVLEFRGKNQTFSKVKRCDVDFFPYRTGATADQQAIGED